MLYFLQEYIKCYEPSRQSTNLCTDSIICYRTDNDVILMPIIYFTKLSSILKFFLVNLSISFF